MSPVEPHGPPSGTPAVGNILGFGLLLRERRALLSLEGRSVARGVRIEHYEAEIPDVKFPLDSPASASAYRQRRCRVRALELHLDLRLVRGWLRERLGGTKLGTMSIAAVSFEPRATAVEGVESCPCLIAEGRGPNGGFAWFLAALRVSASARQLRLEPFRVWTFGDVVGNSRELWSSLAARLRPECARADGGAIEIDAARLALTRPFVTSGWKFPDLSALVITGISSDRHGVTISLAADAQPLPSLPATAPPEPDPVGELVARVRATGGSALDDRWSHAELERLTDLVAHHARARVASLRWRADATRFVDAEHCNRALSEWIELAPNDPEARRLMATRLAADGDARALAMLLASACRLPNPPRRQARLELSLADVMLDKLDDVESAGALLEPLVDRIRTQPELDDLLAPALGALARTRAIGEPSRPRRALDALDEAIRLTPGPRQRAALLARVARGFAAADDADRALRLMAKACEQDPDNNDYLDWAISLSQQAGQVEAAVELLTVRLERADESEVPGVRNRLIELLGGLSDPRFQARALEQIRVALGRSPSDVTLRRRAADIAGGLGNPVEAAEYLAGLMEGADAEERARLQIERARLLESARPDEAVSLLRSLVEHRTDDLEPARVLARMLGERETEGEDHGAELLALHERLLARDPADLARLVAVARLQARFDVEAAAKTWAMVLERVPEDTSLIEPAMFLAKRARERAQLAEAAELLERVVEVDGRHVEALAALDGVAKDVRDPSLTVRTTGRLLETDVQGSARADLLVRRALAHRDLGRVDFALVDMAAATAATVDPERRTELARVWLDIATGDEQEHAEEEAAARAALRAATPQSISSEDVRDEAHLLARLGRGKQGLELIESALAMRPTDEVLIGAIEDLSEAGPIGPAHIRSLDRAIDAAQSDNERDRWLMKLAHVELSHGRGQRAESALERMTPAAARTAEALSLRLETATALGHEAEETRRAEQELVESPRDRLLLSHLVTLLGRTRAVAQLLDLAREHVPTPGIELAESALELARREPAEVGAAIAAARVLVEHGQAAKVVDALPLLGRVALDAKDAAHVVEIVEVALQSDVDELLTRAQRLLELAVIEMPQSEAVSAALSRHALQGIEEPRAQLNAAMELMSGITQRHGLRGEQLARLHAGFATALDGRNAIRFLTDAAITFIADEAAFETFVAELERRELWLQTARLLERKLARTRRTDQKSRLLRRLAEISVDMLDDRTSAIRYLEQARELAPQEPSVLLPLLDHYYEQTDLAQAVDLTLAVLAHVELGDAAYLALAHRAVDAAVATNDYEQAKRVLEAAGKRVPSDARTQKRLAELTELEGDPQHREKMLATIADRRSGTARLEALEERARLLIDPLDRVHEAISVLRTVIEEAPERRVAVRVMGDLYADQGAWSELVALLEDDAQRLQGRERSIVLGRIAAIYRDRLYDMPRAEHALWLAYESTGLEEEDLALHTKLRGELTECLEQQGRYEDLAAFLERELASRDDDDEPSETTLELLTALAHTYDDVLDDAPRAALIYERLQRHGRLPDDGLVCLARWYRSEHRYEDLVRVLSVRAEALTDDDTARRAEIDQRVAELLEGPLRRPQDAARHYLSAYLSDPEHNTVSGARARLLLASTDSIVNVRKRLLDRLPQLPHDRRPALLCLLGDLLAPHDEHEREAEAKYRQAITLAPEFGAAHEGLGRLLARQGRLDAAIDPLTHAAESEAVPADRAAENAAIAARSLFELDRPQAAEQVLRNALVRAPDSQRALLEMARLYNRTGKPDAEAGVLDELSALRLSSMLRAEVTYRRAMLLEPGFIEDPMGETAEQARGFLLAAVSADNNHAAARQVLLDLATRRREWGVVAHMRYLSIRELSPGPQRALVHLDLAETYLEHLEDRESALRNIESALQQGFDDLLVISRASKLSERLEDPADAGARMQAAAKGDEELEASARARLLILAGELHLRSDHIGEAEATWRAAQAVEGVSDEIAAAAERKLESLMSEDDRDLRRQKTGLLRLLDEEEQAPERLHILGRLREIGRALGDDALAQKAADDQLALAGQLARSREHRDQAMAALHDLVADTARYDHVVAILEEVAADADTPVNAARVLTDAARLVWHGLRDAATAVDLLRRALARAPELPKTLSLLGEIAESCDDETLEAAIYRGLAPLVERPPALAIKLAEIAQHLGRDDEAISMLTEVIEADIATDTRMHALRQLDGLLAADARARERLPILEQLLRHAVEHTPDDASDAAHELALLQRSLGSSEQAADTCASALQRDPSHLGLVRLHAELLDEAGDWQHLAETLVVLANLSLEERDQALWLTRAAKVHLDHPLAPHDPAESMTIARRLLERAREVEPEAEGPTMALLPLAFAQGRWAEVLRLAQDLEHAGDSDVLILAALSEALLHARWPLAQTLGPRLRASGRDRYLWPGLRRIVEEVASTGPLPRLDPVLAAAAVLAGGSDDLFRGLEAWAARQPLSAGVALARARLREAHDDRDASRHLYQVAAYLTPDGPLPGLVNRLPRPGLPADPLSARGWVPLEGRTAVQSALIELRAVLAGIRGHGGTAGPPADPRARAAYQTAERSVAEFRASLGARLVVRWSSDRLAGGVGLRNEIEPVILIGSDILDLPAPEVEFRLAFAAGSIANGLAILGDTHPAALVDLLDAMTGLVNPAHEPTTAAARAIADGLSAHGVRAHAVPRRMRVALAEELQHALTSPLETKQLSAVLERANLLFATRLSGRLDGALMAVARDAGILGGEADASRVAALATDQVRWLLRSLRIH